MNDLRPLRVGLLGAGFLAATRARCWRRVHGVPVTLAAVTAARTVRAGAFAESFGIPRVCADATELLTREDVDVVDLCVPNALHRPLAVAAAAAGKHVICTKPLCAYVGQDLPEGASEESIAGTAPERMLAVALADADAMLETARVAGTALLYGENWLHAPAYRKAKELAGAARSPVLEMRGWEAHSGSHSPFSKRWANAGGGALFRLGAHPIGAMLDWKHDEGLRLLGRPVRCVAVTAEVADLSRHPALTPTNTKVATGWGQVENWGCAVLHFDDGSRGVAYGSDVALGGMQSRLELAGGNFTLHCNLSPQDQVRAFHSEPRGFGECYLQEKLDTHAGWSTPMPDEDTSSGQQAMIQHFAQTLMAPTASPRVDELGREVVRVVYSAYRSAREGKRIAL